MRTGWPFQGPRRELELGIRRRKKPTSILNELPIQLLEINTFKTNIMEQKNIVVIGYFRCQSSTNRHTDISTEQESLG